MSPFKKESMTVSGAILALVSFALVQFGGFTEGEAATLALNVAQVIGVLMAWWGRVRLGDTNVFGWRKKVTPIN